VAGGIFCSLAATKSRALTKNSGVSASRTSTWFVQTLGYADGLFALPLSLRQPIIILRLSILPAPTVRWIINANAWLANFDKIKYFEPLFL
jgi:hypothetical protein